MIRLRVPWVAAPWHYVSGTPGNTARATWDFTVVEGGDYTLWFRCNPLQAAMGLGIDGGAISPLDRQTCFGGGAAGSYVGPGSVDNDTHLRQPGRGIVGGRVYDAGGSSAASLAQVPYVCPFATGMTDPESVLDPHHLPNARTKCAYQVRGVAAGPVQVEKAPSQRTVRFVS